MESNHDIYLLLGRLDGKVDALVALHGTTTQRLDGIETRLGSVEQDIASLNASGSSSKTWLANAFSVVAILVAAAAIYFGT